MAEDNKTEAPKSFEEEHATLIKKKMDAGLSREQAIEVIKWNLTEAAKRKK